VSCSCVDIGNAQQASFIAVRLYLIVVVA